MSDQYEDPLYENFHLWMLGTGEATTQVVQNNFRIGYNRASRLIERMEEAGEIKRDNVEYNRFRLCPPARTGESR